MIVKIDSSAIKDLAKISKKDADTILKKLETLEKYPNIPNIKRLNNFDPPYRLRVGNYRALFDIDNNLITVYKIKHRSKIYKKRP